MEMQLIKESIIRTSDFLKASEFLMIDFHNWKSETDLAYIDVEGRRIPVQKCTFIDYFKWRQIIDAEYEIIETHKIENIDYVS